MITIYKGNDVAVLSVEVDDKSYRHRELKGENAITLYFSLAEYVDIPLGAYIYYNDGNARVRYTLLSPAGLKMIHTRNYEYVVTLNAPQAALSKYMFRDIAMAYDEESEEWVMTEEADRRLSFSLTARPEEHLAMLIANLNSKETESDEDWTMGDYVDSDEKVVNYDYMTCEQALQAMAEAFDTEFEIVGKRISLKRVEYNKTDPLPLSYGKGNGFRSGVGRDADSAPVEVLTLATTDRNIDYSKYGAKNLLLPPEGSVLGYDGTTFYTSNIPSSATKFVVCADRLSIKLAGVDLKTGYESSLDAKDVYPTKEHKVKSISSNKGTSFQAFSAAEDAEYGIPQSLDYRDCRIAGEIMTITFQSGELAGRSFDIKQTEAALTGYDHALRKFTIVADDSEDGELVPNETLMPAVGDKFKVFNCMLPDEYICDNSTKTGASWELFKEAAKKLWELKDQKYTFSGDIDPIWARQNWSSGAKVSQKAVIGSYVRFSDARWQSAIDIRIVGVKDYINSPYQIELDLSNEVNGTSVNTEFKKLESTEVVISDTKQETINYTKRRYRDAREAISMLEGIIDGYTGSVSPVAVNTLALLVGDEFLQFDFYDELESDTKLEPLVQFNGATQRFSIKRGDGTDDYLVLRHESLDLPSIIGGVRSASEYHYWEVAKLDVQLLDANQPYYVYADVQKDEDYGTFELVTEAVKDPMDADKHDGHIWLLMGLLGSEVDGERSFTQMYGFTEISGGRITTDKIVSRDGQSWFNISNNTFKLGDLLSFINGELNVVGNLVQRNPTRSVPVYKNSDTQPDAPSGTTFPPSGWRAARDLALDESYATRAGAPTVTREDNNKISIAASYNATRSDVAAVKVTFNTTAANQIIDILLEADFDDSIEARGWLGLLDDDTTLEYADMEDVSIAAFGGVGNLQSHYVRIAVPTVGTHFINVWLTFNRNISFITRKTIHYQIMNTQQPVWVSYATMAGSIATSWTTPSVYSDIANPLHLFQGEFDINATYYGTMERLDMVKYYGAYYIARVGVGEFSGRTPDDKTHWAPFGASFSSVATQLLLAEDAYIENLYVKHLKTVAEDGKGIEAKNNHLWAYNDSGEQTLVISGDDVTSYGPETYELTPRSATRGTAGLQTVRTSGKETLRAGIIGHSGSNLLLGAITLSCSVRVSEVGIVGADESAEAYGKFSVCLENSAGEIFNEIDSKVLATGYVKADTFLTENLVIPAQTIALGNDTYSIVVRWTVDNTGTANLSTSTSFNTTSAAASRVEEASRVTEIGANGLVVRFDGGGARFVEDANGVDMEILLGNNGIKINRSGVRLRLGSSSWLKLYPDDGTICYDIE